MTLPAAPSSTAAPRPHAQRIRYDLDEIRAELVSVVETFTPESFSRSPGGSARSPREILQEIGAMEEASRRWVTHRELPDWGTVLGKLDDATPAGALEKLAAVRAETLVYLEAVQEADLEATIPLPEDWYEYFGGATIIEPEELLRWIGRHEYYHLGQLNTYCFLRDPAA